MIEAKSLDGDVIHFRKSTDSYAWIQFKGTDLCADMHCSKCGESDHFDGDFCYYWECPNCGQIYELNGHVELIPRNREDFSDDDLDYVKKS